MKSSKAPTNPVTISLDQYLQAIIPVAEAMSSAVLIRDSSMRILYANRQFVQLAGIDRDHLAGLTVLELYDEEGQRQLHEIMASRTLNASERYEFYVPHARTGHHTPVMISVGPISMVGLGEDLNLVTLTDITELKHLQEIGRQQAETLARHASFLQEEVRLREAELYQANLDSIYMLAQASEARDPHTGWHVRRIQHLTQALAIEMGFDPQAAMIIGYSSILHDVGKLGIPDEILKKPGPLTAHERKVMQRHTIEGERILGDGAFFAMARRISRCHHEAWDGSGYPEGLKGEQIPIEARLVSVVDTYDALVNERVYKPAWSPRAALAEIERLSGKAFDPQVVAAFGRMWRRSEVEDIYQHLRIHRPHQRSSVHGTGHPGGASHVSGLAGMAMSIPTAIRPHLNTMIAPVREDFPAMGMGFMWNTSGGTMA